MIQLFQRYDEDDNVYYEFFIPSYDLAKEDYAGYIKYTVPELADRLSESSVFECVGYESVGAAHSCLNSYNGVIFRLEPRDGQEVDVRKVWNECMRSIR